MDSEPSHDESISSDAPKSPWLPCVFPAIISLELLVNCLLTSAKKPFWFDEMLTYYLITETSFRHMLVGVQSHFNSLPPLYNVALWGWASVFGTSELGLRLPSSLCFIGAFWALWAVLRPCFGAAPAFAGIAAVFTSHLFAYSAEARAYGLYLLFCALTIYQFACWSSQPKRNWTFYAANTLFHAGMVFTHLFGFLYSACLLLAVLCLDVRKRRVSVPMVGSVLLAWILFGALWLKPTLHQMGIFKPYSWVPIPHLRDLIDAILMDRTRIPIVLAIGIAVCIVLAGIAKRRPQIPSAFLDDNWRSLEKTGGGDAKILAFLAGIFLLLPPAVAYIVSHVSAPVFVDRYFVPSLLAWAILLAFVASELQFRLGAWHKWSGRLQPQHIVTGVALLFLAIVTVATVRRDEYIRYGVDVASLPDVQQLPVVCEDYIYFPSHSHYSPHGSQYFFLLDEDAALQSAPADIGWEMVQYKMMLAVHQQYPAFSIMDWRAFLRTHEQFVVILDKRSRWSQLRLQSDPQYACKETVVQDIYLLWVRKKH